MMNVSSKEIIGFGTRAFHNHVAFMVTILLYAAAQRGNTSPTHIKITISTYAFHIPMYYPYGSIPMDLSV